MSSPSPAATEFRRWGLALTVLSIFLYVGCQGDYRPRAVGEEGVLTVVMDSSHWTGPMGEALREHVTPWVNTLPVSERFFQIKHLEFTSEGVYNRVQKLKNVIIAAPLSDSTNEANFLRRRFSKNARKAIMNGENAVVSKPNLWRRSQRVYYVTAATSDGIVEAFEKQGSQIRQTFEDITMQRMERHMYENGRNRALEDSLMERHGFSLKLQPDVQLAIDTTTAEGGFVWLRRLLARTRREVFVYYRDDVSPDEITPEWVYNTRDSLTREYMRGNISGFVRIDYRRPLNTYQISFQDRYGFETKGLWFMATPVENGEGFRPVGGGGPFVNYTFYDQATDRVYMIDGSVFAPDFDKLRFLRQMEIMAKTFRTAEGQSNSQGSAPEAEE